MDKKNIDRIFEEMVEKNIDLPKQIEYDYIKELRRTYKIYRKILRKYKKYIPYKLRKDAIDFSKIIMRQLNNKEMKASKELMEMIDKLYEDHLLTVYNKSFFSKDRENFKETLILYRIRDIDKKGVEKFRTSGISRKAIFHAPYEVSNNIKNLEKRSGSGRYKRINYPCLYLGTSLKICLSEKKKETENFLVSSFRLDRWSGMPIEILELGIKPSDFLKRERVQINRSQRNRYGYAYRNFDEINLSDIKVKRNFLYWYPLIAACSFIKKYETDEYLISNYLMEWIVEKNMKRDSLTGLRYFSCADTGFCSDSSELGFNYVLPASKCDEENKYCSKLSKAVLINNPAIFEIKNTEDLKLIDKAEKKYKEASGEKYLHLEDCDECKCLKIEV